MNKQQYIAYLVATPGNATCTNLADHLDGEPGTSHDAVSDFLRREKLTPRGLWNVVAPLLSDSPEAYLVFDDSVQDKRYSSRIELVRRQYSGAVGGLVRGIGVLNLLHVDDKGDDFFPIDYRIYDPDGDGKSKNDHFREMLVRAKTDKRIKAKTILFDTWYASVDNLKLVIRMGMTFVTTLKSNRLVSLSKEAGYVHLQDLEWTEDRLLHGIKVKLKELPHPVQLFKAVSKNGDVEWLITNCTTSSQDGSGDDNHGPIETSEVQTMNSVRWRIEQLHRELKQLTGTEKCQCRKARSQRNHIACGYLAWLSLKMAARSAQTTLYAIRKWQLRDYLRNQLKQPSVAIYTS